MSSWRSLLLRIGDKCADYGASVDFKEHIETCYGVVRRELEFSEEDVLQFLLQCAEQLPHKIPMYATLIGLLNLESEDFVGKLVENTHICLQEAIDSENCDRIRIMMRFVTIMTCSKVIQPGSLVVLFETLLSSAATTIDEDKGNPSWQARADFYITCILSSLPYGGTELFEQVPEEVERVMVGVEAYLGIRKRISDNASSFFVKDEQTDEKDFLEDLWNRISVLSGCGWKLDSVPRPHLSFEAQLIAGKLHDFRTISCPEQPGPLAVHSEVSYGRQKHEADMKYPQRIRRLNIFPTSKTEEDLQPIDRYIVEEYLLDVLLFFNGWFLVERNVLPSWLVCLCLFAMNILWQRQYSPSYFCFHNHHSSLKTIYYTLGVIDLCKALPGAFPAVIAGAVRTLFEKIDDLDMECRTRLVIWFAHHLSNFQFIWPWEEWVYVLDLPKWAPQRVFVQEVLEREVRLSYWDKVKQSIETASALEELLPHRGGPNFKYSVENSREKTEEDSLSTDLSSMVKGKVPSREVTLWVEESVFPVLGYEATLRVVIQTLLDIGSKSFTHLITVLERYGQVIAKMCPDQDKQIMLIDEVNSYWKNSSQMAAIAIDRMMGYRLISNLAIVRWIFSPLNIQEFHTSDRPWEILRNAVSKTYNRICDLRKEISFLNKAVASAEQAAAKAKAELEAAESKLILVDGQPVVGENPGRMNRLKSHALKNKEEVVTLRDSLDAKEALLTRALDENEALFMSLYKNFAIVLKERIPEGYGGTLRGLKGIREENMSVDSEETSQMDVDEENGKPKKSRNPNGRTGTGYNVGEQEQWCLSTLGYVKAFSRQYASEIWPYVEKLDAEVLTEDTPLLMRRAVYSGLRRSVVDA